MLLSQQTPIFAPLKIIMLRKAIFVLLCFISFKATAQNEADAAYSKPSRDYFMFQVEYDGWFHPSQVATAAIDLVTGIASGTFSNAIGDSGMVHHFDWVGGHSNNGHGNNLDGVDSSNPGQGGGGPNGEVDPSGGIDDEIRGPNGVAGNYFEWGTVATGNQNKVNSTTFEGSSFSVNNPGQSFFLGDFFWATAFFFLPLPPFSCRPAATSSS